ncbi:MAG: hypothetical protein M3R31_10535 [Pseudomonadota bacterium]|nr:hypothetical protein [Pseudomonadota bacterium]
MALSEERPELRGDRRSSPRIHVADRIDEQDQERRGRHIRQSEILPAERCVPGDATSKFLHGVIFKRAHLSVPHILQHAVHNDSIRREAISVSVRSSKGREAKRAMPKISVVIASKVGAPFIDQCLGRIFSRRRWFRFFSWRESV